MNPVLWLALGALSGFVSRVLLNCRASSVWLDIATGVVGAALGGFIAVRLGLSAHHETQSVQCACRSGRLMPAFAPCRLAAPHAAFPLNAAQAELSACAFGFSRIF